METITCLSLTVTLMSSHNQFTNRLSALRSLSARHKRYESTADYLLLFSFFIPLFLLTSSSSNPIHRKLVIPVLPFEACDYQAIWPPVREKEWHKGKNQRGKSTSEISDICLPMAHFSHISTDLQCLSSMRARPLVFSFVR